jgi:hypothetical protein
LISPYRDPISVAAAQSGVTAEDVVDHPRALAWFIVEHHVLLAAVRLAASAGFDTHTQQLAWSLSAFLDLRGHWHDLAATQHAGLAAAEQLAPSLLVGGETESLRVAFGSKLIADSRQSRSAPSAEATRRSWVAEVH